MHEIDLNIGVLYFGNSRTRLCMAYYQTGYEAWKCCKILCASLSRINTGKFRIIYQMIGYSIEMLLKTCILWNDYSDEAKKILKQKHCRHNLEELFDKLPTATKNVLNNKEKKQIFRLNKYYSDAQNFRYLTHIDRSDFSFNFKLPDPNNYFKILGKLYKNAKQIIYAN